MKDGNDKRARPILGLLVLSLAACSISTNGNGGATEGRQGLSASPVSLNFSLSIGTSTKLTISNVNAQMPVESSNCASNAPATATISPATEISSTSWSYTVAPSSQGNCSATFTAGTLSVSVPIQVGP